MTSRHRHCATSPAGPLGCAAKDIELIINGDCFDFLMIQPFVLGGTISPAAALEKLEKVIAAHRPFFELLREFIHTPERHVTFITGNHDIELCFKEVRTRIVEAIYGEPGYRTSQSAAMHGELNFYTSRFYRPLPDVYLEHGNHYDFWNHISDIWDDEGDLLTLNPNLIKLPIGSQYMLHAGYPISITHPYFDHFEPSMNIMRQFALLSLLHPDLVIQTTQRVMGMLSYPRKALADLAPSEESIPARLFEHAMLDFVAFQQDAEARFSAWKLVESIPQSDPAQAPQEEEMAEFLALRDALALPLIEAVAAICTPVVYNMGESVARGMRHVLNSDPALRYATAGHTHMWLIEPINNAKQVYLNSGTWTTRVALPAPGEITPDLVEWLRQPDWKNIPLRDLTQYTFVMINTTPEGQSSGSLCAWDGGSKGSYKVLG